MAATLSSTPDRGVQTRAVGRTVAQMFGSNIGVLVLYFGTGIITARSLGAAGRGEVAAVLTLLQTLSIAGAFGIWEGMIFHASRNDHWQRNVRSTAAAFTIAMAVVSVVVAELLLPTLFAAQSDALVQDARMLMLLVVGYFMFEASLAMAAIRQRFGLLSTIRFVQPLLHAIGLVILWLAHAVTVSSVVLVIGTSHAAVSLLALGALRRDLEPGPISPALARQSLRFGVRIFGGRLSQKGNHELDLLVMPTLVRPEVLGVYAIAASVASMIAGAFGGLRSVVLSSVSRQEAGEGEAVILQMARLVIAAAVTAAAGLAIVGPFMIRLVYGSEFEGAITPMWLLLPGIVCFVVADLLLGALAALDRPLDATRATFAGLVVTVVGLAFLVRPYGASGAAFTSTAAYVTLFVLELRALHRAGFPVRLLFRFDLIVEDVRGLSRLVAGRG